MSDYRVERVNRPEGVVNRISKVEWLNTGTESGACRVLWEYTGEEVDQMRNLLRVIEQRRIRSQVCPICDAPANEWHRSGCEWDAWIHPWMK